MQLKRLFEDMKADFEPLTKLMREVFWRSCQSDKVDVARKRWCYQFYFELGHTLDQAEGRVSNYMYTSLCQRHTDAFAVAQAVPFRHCTNSFNTLLGATDLLNDVLRKISLVEINSTRRTVFFGFGVLFFGVRRLCVFSF